MVVGITGDMEPSAGVNQSWVPALQHICWIRQPPSQCIQSIPFKIPKPRNSIQYLCKKQKKKQTQKKPVNYTRKPLKTPSELVEREGETKRRTKEKRRGREAILVSERNQKWAEAKLEIQ